MSNLIHRYHHLGTATENFKDRLDQRSQLVEDVLTRVVIDTLRRYQQRVHVGIQDSVADLLATFKLKVAEEIYHISQNWMVATYREPVLFPINCRFLYTLGTSTIVVIEQSPAVRSLRLDMALLGERTGHSYGEAVTTALAIPYTVFVLHFRNTMLDGSGKEQFNNLYIGWRCAPLSSLNGEICVPYLPNIYPNNYTVCTGLIDLVSDRAGGAAISELTHKVISDFWNSVFNADLSSHWWDKAFCPEVSTAEVWERNTTEDPLFILSIPLDKTQTPPTTVWNLINRIGTATEERATEAADLRHRISETTDALSERLFHGIKNYLHKTKFDRFYPKDVTDNLATVMEDVAKQLRVVALGIEIELNNISQEVDNMRQDDYGWRKRGAWWTD